MIVGHHLVWTSYGSWLPNDPRGSSSHEIRVERIAELGDLHHGRKRVQPSRTELREFYREAKPLLAHPTLEFGDAERAVIAESFRQTVRRRVYTCYACAIMPDHVHMLVRRHRDHGDEMIQHLQTASRDALIAADLRPGGHPVWGGPGWKVYQNSRQDMERIVRYIAKNPAERGMTPQVWDFVTAYDGWLPAGAKRQ